MPGGLAFIFTLITGTRMKKHLSVASTYKSRVISNATSS